MTLIIHMWSSPLLVYTGYVLLYIFQRVNLQGSLLLFMNISN